MSEFKTFKTALLAVMLEHGMLVKAADSRAIIQPLTKDGLINIISSYSVHLDDVVVDALELTNYIGTRREFRIHTLSLVEYDSNFWHFSNGFTGTDDTIRSLFVREMKANDIYFQLDDRVIDSSEFVAYTPDRVVLWFYTIALALAIQTTMDQIWSTGLGGFVGETITHLSTLLGITGSSYAIFAENIANFKGLSKACGDWAVDSNRVALAQLRNLNGKIVKTIKSPYDVCAHVSTLRNLDTDDSHKEYVAFVKDSLKYFRTYGQIALVMLSFLFGAVMPKLDTPADAISSNMSVLYALGRLEHSLFVKARDNLGSRAVNLYVGSN